MKVHEEGLDDDATTATTTTCEDSSSMAFLVRDKRRKEERHTHTYTQQSKLVDDLQMQRDA